MTGELDKPDAKETAAGDIAKLVGKFADGVKAASAGAREKAAASADRLRQEAKDHPLETVTGAFGLGYLVGKALFKRRPR